MPPKKAPAKGVPTDKKILKEAQKTAEDKTFGLKNKNKSKVVQKVMKGMASLQTKGGIDRIISSQWDEKKLKEDAEKERAFLASIKLGDINAMSNANMGPQDPKQTICPYFKAGLCQKGKKCKYSHDKGGDNIGIKASLYQDIRGEDADDMKNWDQKKLEEAVNYNEGKYLAKVNATDKICDQFLNAVQAKKYGWFWVCPNGYNCKYKHALPPGFILKSDVPEEEEVIKTDMCADIDELREGLSGQKGTPVTYERFYEWKERRKARKLKENQEKKVEELKKAGHKVKKNTKVMSGRALFAFDSTLFQDADDAAGKIEVEKGEEEETIESKQKGKAWGERVKEEIIEENVDEEDEEGLVEEKIQNEQNKEEDQTEANNEKIDEDNIEEDNQNVEVDEDLFADEEELPEDLE